MTKYRWIALVAFTLLLAGAALYSYQRGLDDSATRAALLALMPPDASYVLFADVAEIRNSPFAMQLYKWVPPAQIDPEYSRFLRDTGFDYERDLDRVAIAVLKRGSAATVFAVADGRFDRKKIEAYVAHAGAPLNGGTNQIFSLPINDSSRNISLAFLRADRIALTDDSNVAALLSSPAKNEDARQWQERFERLAGSPVFAVIRQDAAASNALASQAPGGFQSPQLSALLNQLLWITLAGKPEGDTLRVVAEGECAEDRTARQLADLLGGTLLLAQAGLNGADMRRQLAPQARDAYLQILRSADIASLDRGETKSVRVIFDVTPKLLEVAKTAASIPTLVPSSLSPSAPGPGSNTGKRRSRRANSPAAAEPLPPRSPF